MISLLSGVPGSGKTYYALVHYILEILGKGGRKVITNIPLNMPLIEGIYGASVAERLVTDELDFADVGIYQVEGGFAYDVTYVIDEAQEHYTKDKLEENTEVMQFLSRHRKYGVDIILITQNVSLLYRKVSALIELGHYLSKMRAIGGDGYIVKTHTGKSSRSAPISQSEHRYEVRYFPLYQSYSKDGVVEAQPKSASFMTKFFVFIYKRFVFVIIFILSLVAHSIYKQQSHAASSFKAQVNSVPVPSVRQSVPVIASPTVQKPKGLAYRLSSLSRVDDVVVSCRISVSRDSDDEGGVTSFLQHKEGGSVPRERHYDCARLGASVRGDTVTMPWGEVL